MYTENDYALHLQKYAIIFFFVKNTEQYLNYEKSKSNQTHHSSKSL